MSQPPRLPVVRIEASNGIGLLLALEWVDTLGSKESQGRVRVQSRLKVGDVSGELYKLIQLCKQGWIGAATFLASLVGLSTPTETELL